MVIGGGAAGEAAGSLGGELGLDVVLVERELVGGECAFWACMPSKALLDSASRRAIGADYPWRRASARRDWMISREGTDRSSDGSHVRALEDSGATFIRGSARIAGPGRVEISVAGRPLKIHETRSIIIASGSVPFIPEVDGLEEAGYWTNREATSVRELPSSIAIVGGGPVGVEIAQIYTRFGVEVHLIEKYPRIMIKDHPRSAQTLDMRLKEEGVTIYNDTTAIAVRRGGKGRIVELADGRKVEAAELLIAVGRVPDMKGLGLEELGIELIDGKRPPRSDSAMSIGPGVYVAGDAAGGLQFTHVADYQGRIAVMNAAGTVTSADLSAVPRTTFTDPETSAVGLTVDEARAQGLDVFEISQDFAATARGQSIEGSSGHVSAVVDADRGLLVGAFAACPGASEMIMEAVLAIKQSIPVHVLADAIHPFPTASRVFGNVMSQAVKRLNRSSS